MTDRIKVRMMEEGDITQFYFAEGVRKNQAAFAFRNSWYDIDQDRHYPWLNRDGDSARIYFQGFEIINFPKSTPNTITVKASCGQETTLDLGIGENQNISEVTIRGVTYVPK